MKLQIFTIKKFLKFLISLNSALKRHENYYPQVFLKECRYIKKKLIRHIIDDLERSDDSDESDEEQIKAMKKKIILINAEFWLANKSMIYNEVSKQNTLYINKIKIL